VLWSIILLLYLGRRRRGDEIDRQRRRIARLFAVQCNLLTISSSGNSGGGRVVIQFGRRLTEFTKETRTTTATTMNTKKRNGRRRRRRGRKVG